MQTCVSSLAAFGGRRGFRRTIGVRRRGPQRLAICANRPSPAAPAITATTPIVPKARRPHQTSAISATTPLAMSISPGALAPFSMEASACWRMVRAWVDGVVYVSPYDCARIGQLTNEYSYDWVPPVGQARSRRYGPPPTVDEATAVAPSQNRCALV